MELKNEIIKSELGAFALASIIIVTRIIDNGFDSMAQGETFANISIFLLRIVYLKVMKKELFYSYVMTAYLLICIGLSMVFYNELGSIFFGFLLISFIYNLILNMLPKSKSKLFGFILNKLNKSEK